MNHENEMGEPNSKCNNRYLWNEPETLLLINLYKENDGDYSAGKLTHRKFWRKIVDGINDKGHNISVNQCINKMDSLKRVYKKIEDHNNQSGNGRKSCNYYENF